MPRMVRRRGYAQAPAESVIVLSRGMRFFLLAPGALKLLRTSPPSHHPSARRLDFMLVRDTVLLFAAVFAVLNLFADLANALLDRRA